MLEHIGPTSVGRYEIKGLIAQGGMGDLYLARDPNTSRFVALKLLNANLDSSDLRERFEREARALASLNHPNIIHIYDYGDFQGSPFIVMEYVRGETLAEKIKRQAPLSVGHKLALMTELCAGLAHAHHAGIIHRDVKPANLMVTQDGRLKILDFGIARMAGSNLTRAGTALTLVNMQVGTPGYMSPEQVQGGEIDHRTDVFAAGAVCYELLAYREAFPGASTREVEHKVMRTQPVPLAPLLPNLDPGIGAIVTRALAKDRKKRYQDIAELREELERYRAKLGTSDAPPLPPPDLRVGPYGSRAEGTYQRALALYQDGAHDAARRFAIEALAEDANHYNARALLEGLEPKARGKVPAQPKTPTPAPTEHLLKESSTELVSPTDPTVFIPRAKLPAPSTTEETIFIPRTDRSARVSPKGPVVPSNRTKAPTSSFWTGLEPLLAMWPEIQTQLSRGWKSVRLPRKSYTPGSAGTLWKQYKRSGAMVVGLVALAAGTVLLAMGLTGRIGSSGQVLTITKPVGGTILSAGITCGTRGSECSMTTSTGDPVELVAEADQGFAFGGFTGDCAPTGRTAMTVSRTCGALFTPIVTPPSATTWTLTIARPEGGTILAAGDIQCGSFAAACSAELPNLVPLTLHATPDAGYAFLSYTGDCAPSGHTIMNGPRTCGATFAPSGAALQAPRPIPATPRKPQPPPTVTTLHPAPGVPPAAFPGADSQQSNTQSPPVPGDKADNPITLEAHAKNEIPRVIKEYCAALTALDPVRVQKVYPSVDMRALRERYKQYRSNKCAATGAPEFLELNATMGTARIEVGMKQALEMRIGGAPDTSETIAEITLSRPELRTSWVIVSVKHTLKPKD